MSLPLRTLLLCSLSFVFGCPSESDDDDSFGPPDDDDVADTCVEDTDCRDYDEGLEICDDGGICVEGDRNNARDEAQLLAYDSTATLVVAPAGDTDWFRFNGTEGDMLLISVTADDELDPVVIYTDGQGNQIGFNDDFERIGVTDSRLYVGVPSTGTFYLQVQDKRSWVGDPNDPPEGGSDYGYEITLTRAGGSTNVPLIVEPNEVLGDALDWPVTAYSTNYTLGGQFEEEGDVDWLSVPVLAGETLRLYGFPNTGTAARPAVTVLMPDGVTPIRTYTGLAWSAQSRGLIPVLESGEYTLRIEDDNGTAGFDHWFYLHAAKNEPEEDFDVEVEPNGSDSPEALAFSAGSAFSRRFYGRIGAPGDEDHFSLTANGSETVTVRFERTEHGETTNPVVTLLDPSGAAATSGAWDGDPKSPALTLAPMDSAGTWTLVITDADSSVGHGGRYYVATVSVVP